jgi:hypothetical protein
MSSVIEFWVENIFFLTVYMKLLVSIWKKKKEVEKKRKKAGYLMDHLPPFQVGPTCVREGGNLDSGLICMRVISSALNKRFGFELYL